MSYIDYLKDHFNNIKFVNNPNWVIGGIDQNGYINQIVKIKEFKSKNKVEEELMLFAMYMEEAWLGETDVDISINTVDVVDTLLEDEDNFLSFLQEKQNMKLEEALHLSKKLKNLKKVIQEELFNTTDQQYTITIDEIKRIHSVIANGIILTPGVFRNIQVKPAGSDFRYCHPNNIDISIQSLIDFTNEMATNILNGESTVEFKTNRMFLLGALFFSEFLYIHPFRNGNGRLARILLSRLLKPVTKVPFSIYWKDRKTYIDAVESRNDRNVQPPNTLATFILLCASRCASEIIDHNRYFEDSN